VVLNKWDRVDLDARRKKAFLADVQDRLRFMPYAPILTVSALTGKRVAQILPASVEVFEEYNRRAATAAVNQALEDAVQRHEPPYAGQRRLKFYYATQISVRPPTFVLFCNYPKDIHFSYQRYLVNHFRDALGLQKVPVRLIFRARRRRDSNT
jgi:GTP-binding protein